MYRQPEGTQLMVIVEDNHLVAVDAATGVEAWDLRLSGGRGTPRLLVTEERVYVARLEMVFCVEYATGRGLWKGDLPADPVARWKVAGLVLEGDRLFVSSFDDIVAFHAETGERLWTRTNNQGSRTRSFGFPGNVSHGDDYGMR